MKRGKGEIVAEEGRTGETSGAVAGSFLAVSSMYNLCTLYVEHLTY